MNNLNSLLPETDQDGLGSYRRSMYTDSNEISVYFDNLEGRLVELIQASTHVVGCVAWLTNRKILQALVGKNAHFIVQKEDFLRPDAVSNAELHALYKALDKTETRRCNYIDPVNYLSLCSDQTFEGVRCVGNHNSTRNKTFPRMHHKFCLFGHYKPGLDADIWNEDGGAIAFNQVWTGSFNFTYNSTNSLENAVLISQPDIVAAYYREWAHITALSEPLDWTNPWSEPEWRIGT